MQLPEFLSADSAGHIHVTGHRIGLEDIVFFYRRGDSPEMLRLQFPTVSLSTMHRIIAHYLDHQMEIDSYVDASLAENERLRETTPKHGPTLDELRQRFSQRYARGA
ncbi:MAG: hypothetical protein JNJ77_17080 [Planctomycetia bacterium]|nr:hypothetical protein [Planctomycetia bacterium]